MNTDEVRAAKRAIVERHGAWRGYNLKLGPDVYTMSPGLVGAAELNILRVLQVVTDHAPKPLSELRILDLGANEGGFATEFASHGARVRSIEGREGHVAKAKFAAECLGLDNVEITQGDVRDLDRERDGGFDVVLCLGILYHLPAEDVYPFLARVASVCDGFTVIETNISLAAQTDGCDTSGRTARPALPRKPSLCGSSARCHAKLLADSSLAAQPARCGRVHVSLRVSESSRPRDGRAPRPRDVHRLQGEPRHRMHRAAGQLAG